MKWTRVTIFISSTFNDMHAERDYLVKDVFPELREWCEERKIHLIDVDLRWGVTEEDSSSNHTVLACLNNIDESRPFFLCFLGQRRGWVPGKGEVSPETMDEYPDISGAIGRNSVTEMEIEHALLSPMRHFVNGNEKQEIPVRHALFYFRNPAYLDDLTNDQRKIFTNEAEEDIDLADRELIQFKEKIKSNWDYTVDYGCNWDKHILSPELPATVHQGRLTDFSTDGKELKETIIRQLKEEIIKEFPDREKVEFASDLERDLDQQALFIELNSEGFISREGDFDAINEYITNDRDGLFVLTASAGSGKSMLLANFIQSESKKHTGRFLGRFCGVSDLSSQQYSLWKTILEEADVSSVKIEQEIEKLGKISQDELDEKSREIRIKYSLNNWLPNKDELKKRIEEIFELLSKKKKTTIVLDAINQLTDGFDMLEWLPKKLPQNLKIILSIKEDQEDKEITAGIEKLKTCENISYSTVSPFEGKKEKKKLIQDYLKKYLKALDDQQIDTICNFEGSKNPLYLKVLLSELRIFGSFGQLSKEIQLFGETPREAFDTVLNRLENDINSSGIDSKAFVTLLFGLLVNARNGLSEKEIISCMRKELGMDEKILIQTLRLFVRQVRPFMARREGRIDYFYEAFKLAAKERYIDHKVHNNKLLADCFKAQADLEADLSFSGKNIRDFNELPYHLKESENIVGLGKILSTYLWIKHKTELSDIENTINDYNYIDVEDRRNYHVKMIKDALVLSSSTLQERWVKDAFNYGEHFLERNIRDNLPTQLWARLKDIEISPIKEFLIEIDKYTDYPWLKQCLHIPIPEKDLFVEGGVCFSPDSRYVMFGVSDFVATTVYIWDLEKQAIKYKLEEHFSINCMCFSPDGKYVVLGGGKIVCVWDLKKQKRRKKFEHKNRVKNVCFSPDGRYLVSGEASAVHVWDWKEQTKIQMYSILIPPRRAFLFAGNVAVCPDGKHLVLGIEGGYSDGNHSFFTDESSAIHIWDWEKQETITELKKHRTCVRVSPEGKHIISGSWNDKDYSIHVWNWEKQKEIKMSMGTGRVTGISISPNGTYGVSRASDTIIRVWEYTRESLGLILSTQTEGFGICAFSNNKNQIVVAEMNGILIYNIQNLPEGIVIVTPLCDSNKKLSVKCCYCDKYFDICEDDLGNIVNCTCCGKKMQVNHFTAMDHTNKKGFFSRIFERNNKNMPLNQGDKQIQIVPPEERKGWAILE